MPLGRGDMGLSEDWECSKAGEQMGNVSWQQYFKWGIIYVDVLS